MKQQFRTIFLLAVLVNLLFGCVKNNPLPVYIEIDSWELNSNGVTTGQNYPGELTKNLTDAWVYVDEKLVGVFELPCKIPVLVEGNKKVLIYPTIRNNGISSTKKIYPFLEPFEVYKDFTPGSTIQISPNTRYYTTTKFWIEDFESATVKIETNETTSTADLIRESLSSISISGSYGKISLSSTENSWTGYTEGIVLPKNGKEIYLEIDYHNTNSLLTGVRAIDEDAITTTDHPNIALNAQDASTVKWKKIYIDLKEIVSYSVLADKFKQYLVADLKEGSTSEVIYIDNIKVVYF
jgi:hypothetical protein